MGFSQHHIIAMPCVPTQLLNSQFVIYHCHFRNGSALVRLPCIPWSSHEWHEWKLSAMMLCTKYESNLSPFFPTSRPYLQLSPVRPSPQNGFCEQNVGSEIPHFFPSRLHLLNRVGYGSNRQKGKTIATCHLLHSCVWLHNECAVFFLQMW